MNDSKTRSESVALDERNDELTHRAANRLWNLSETVFNKWAGYVSVMAGIFSIVGLANIVGWISLRGFFAYMHSGWAVGLCGYSDYLVAGTFTIAIIVIASLMSHFILAIAGSLSQQPPTASLVSVIAVVSTLLWLFLVFRFSVLANFVAGDMPTLTHWLAIIIGGLLPGFWIPLFCAVATSEGQQIEKAKPYLLLLISVWIIILPMGYAYSLGKFYGRLTIRADKSALVAYEGNTESYVHIYSSYDRSFLMDPNTFEQTQKMYVVQNELIEWIGSSKRTENRVDSRVSLDNFLKLLEGREVVLEDENVLGDRKKRGILSSRLLGNDPSSIQESVIVEVVSWNVGASNSHVNDIAQQLATLRSDIYALQEVAPDNTNKFAQAIGNQFDFTLSKTDEGGRLMIAYDKSRFNKILSLNLDHLNYGDRHPPLAVTLEEKKSKSRFVVVTVHQSNTDVSQRLAQSKGLTEWASQQRIPIMAIGDFNFDPPIAKKPDEALLEMFRGSVWRWPTTSNQRKWAEKGEQNDYGAMSGFCFTANFDLYGLWMPFCEVVSFTESADDEIPSSHLPIRTTVIDSHRLRSSN